MFNFCTKMINMNISCTDKKMIINFLKNLLAMGTSLRNKIQKIKDGKTVRQTDRQKDSQTATFIAHEAWGKI